MSTNFGGQSMVDPLRRVLVRPPDEAFAIEDPERWNYTSRPDLDLALKEHEALVEILTNSGAEVVVHKSKQPDRADSIYVFDPVLMTNRGAVLLRMGKSLRQGEEKAIEEQLDALNIPTLFALTGSARAEGGDMLWLDTQTLLVGIGFRTNIEGVRQLQAGLIDLGIDVVPVDLPYFSGPRACLHLLSLISLLDHDLAVVYPPLLPVRLWQELTERHIGLIEVPANEFPTMGPNVLALGPRNCLMLEGNTKTQSSLEAEGCTVQTYSGNEISLKAEGGPTCLTQPLLRRA